MTGLSILGIAGLYKVSSFFSALNTLSYNDVSVLASFLWYVNSDYFEFSFSLTISPTSSIIFTVSLSSGFDV